MAWCGGARWDGRERRGGDRLPRRCFVESAGIDLGGVVAGGNVDVNGAALVLGGSYTDQFAGDGGEVDILALGNIRFFGTGVAVRADAGTNFDGAGGTLTLAWSF